MPDPLQDLAWPAYAAEIGRRVSTVRRMRRVSQTELANAAGVARSQIQNIESSKSFRQSDFGNTTLRTLFSVAQALGVAPTVFIPEGVPQPEYGTGADRERIESLLAAEVAKRPLPPTTRPSPRVH